MVRMFGVVVLGIVGAGLTWLVRATVREIRDEALYYGPG
jgi:Ni2+-binding GTPase involved in maturation of urease and hydrogenase